MARSSSAGASVTLGGMSMKSISLVTLTVQNSALILIMHYSRIMPLVDGQRYHTSTSVFLNEVIKLGISLAMALHELSQTHPSTSISTLLSTLNSSILSKSSAPLAIPAVLYTIQNTLQYVAVSNLDAATFQVTYQLKILTTAMFSVAMLGRKISARKWVALVLLGVGVAIIQVPQYTSSTSTEGVGGNWAKTFEDFKRLGSVTAHKLRSPRSEPNTHTGMNSHIGLLAVLTSCILSGLAGVTFEKILKSSSSTPSAPPTTLWIRNCQLSFWSLFPSLFWGVLYNDGAAIQRTGFFAGYNTVVWAAIACQAAGGIVVSLTINYADNIAKNFATSVSIVGSCIASAWFFNFRVTPSFFVGTCVVLFATYLYTKPERTPQLFKDAEKEGSPVALQYVDTRLPSNVPSPFSLFQTSHTASDACVAMDDESYYDYDDRHQLGAQHHASRLPFPQPHFKQPAQPVPTRDRFRSMHYDDIEDDVPYGRSEGIQFDSFDDRVLQQPFPDRQQQAEQGRARLSLNPGSSKFFNNAVASQSQVSYQPHEHAAPSQSHRLREHDEYGERGRFANNANQPPGSSSDIQLGPSSSPALKAGQRRAETTTKTTEHRGSGTHFFEDERQHGKKHERHFAERPFRPLVATQPRTFEDEQSDSQVQQRTASTQSVASYDPPRPRQNPVDLPHAPPICQGIQLVPVSALPDRLRTVFPYPTFNAVQSKCFDRVFRSDDNFVLASPTGSGKTVILELAICRAVATNATGQYKVVYQAPTKALCAERQRDWEAKFTPIGLKCAELTGDSDASDVRNVQSANIIITTPEKWDSITRKWKDHEKLMRLIKLFLIDEVHILKEDRGAVLEAVVSRMKSIGTDVRFVALSATVPNFHDVAAWLGKNSADPHTPAANDKFGEEFRPVKLRKHVCGYTSNSSNDFGFEKVLDAKLPEVIAKYSEGKPIMVFCATRASCLKTARLIANWWISKAGNDRIWAPPTRQIPLVSKDLRETVASGVAFHHAGLDLDDRTQVEKGFLSHDINVICCTSTLAVGVNLPCHLVIVKNTVSYTDEGLQEYSDLEMMQMLGRAGRPQFDDTAVAVIMTRQAKARRYELMVTGQDLLESKLHSNLIDHMNAEIGLGTIRDLVSARKWLTGTFLYVRLQQNPNHYKLEGARSGQNIEEQVDDICFRDIALLREHSLVSGEEYFRCTEFGHAMARYYIHFNTMRVFMGIQSKATPSEILSAIAQASEFSKLRFRAGEKPLYKLLNKSASIRFSIPVNLDLPAHKVSLIIQSVLGSADMLFEGENAKHRGQYATEVAIIFKNINSLIRCIIDCQICLGDSVSIHSALLLERSLGSRIWDDSPLQMKQIEGIGVVAVRKFVNAGIRSMEDLENADAHRIETLVGRNPPFGMKVLEMVRAFPKLRVSMHAQASSITKCPEGVKIQIKADIGFINEKPPQRFAGKLVYVLIGCSGQKLGSGQSLTFPALLTSHEQSINCYVMCDSIGDLRGATVKPKIAPSMFPMRKSPEADIPQQSNTSKRRAEPVKPARKRSTTSDEFGDDEIDDDELMKVSVPRGDLEFEHIDNFANPMDAITRKNTAKNKTTKPKALAKSIQTSIEDDDQAPVQLANGKWACSHKCKDRIACKHLCCKDGMDKPPKKSAATKSRPSGNEEAPFTQHVSTKKVPQKQSKLQLTASKRKISSAVEELDLTQQEKKKKADYANNGPRDYRDLHQLHKNVQKKDPPSTLLSVMHKKPEYCYSQGGDYNLSFLQQQDTRPSGNSSDYGEIPLDDELSTHFEQSQPATTQQDLINFSKDMDESDLINYPATAPVASHGSDTFGDDDSLLGDAMIGLVDSQDLREVNNTSNSMDTLEGAINEEYEAGFQDDDFPTDVGDAINDDTGWQMREETPVTPLVPARKPSTQKTRMPFNDSTSSARPHFKHSKPTKPMLQVSEPDVLEHPKDAPRASHSKPGHKLAEVEDIDVLDLSDDFDDPPAKAVKPVPEAFKDLEPWLFAEFGDIVELVDE
ncbi:hypothetical protein CC86DRAFT_284183 [Ophiobolus disseminans]|uniref:DNA 3'-5' helicase n=1 Tax=Ophiobolus disseminans TaxID=1469910 RepID=A0A6A7AAZ2_9PLEO|nr:hypothetical protein CC86DRAFT_284183 [Ophiobolus disseminans]